MAAWSSSYHTLRSHLVCAGQGAGRGVGSTDKSNTQLLSQLCTAHKPVPDGPGPDCCCPPPLANAVLRRFLRSATSLTTYTGPWPMAHRSVSHRHSSGVHTEQLGSLVEADHERREAVGQVCVGVECQRVGEGVDEKRGAEAGVGRVGVGRQVAQAVGVRDGGVGGAVRGVRHLVRNQDLDALFADLRAAW